MIVEESEFKGNPMIVLKRDADDKYPFQFGLSKAKLVLQAIPQITEWVAKQEFKKKNDGQSAPPAETPATSTEDIPF